MLAQVERSVYGAEQEGALFARVQTLEVHCGQSTMVADGMPARVARMFNHFCA